MDPILEVKGLYKVFGEAPERAFSLIEKALIKTIFLNKLA